MGNLFGRQSQEQQKLLEVYASCLNHLQMLDVASRALVEGMTAQQKLVDMLTSQPEDPGARHHGTVGSRDMLTMLSANQKCGLLQACNVSSNVENLLKEQRYVQNLLTKDQTYYIMQNRIRLTNTAGYGSLPFGTKQKMLNDVEKNVVEVLRIKEDLERRNNEVKSRQSYTHQNKPNVYSQQHRSEEALFNEMDNLQRTANDVEQLIHRIKNRKTGNTNVVDEVERELNKRQMSIASIFDENQRFMQRSQPLIEKLQCDIQRYQQGSSSLVQSFAQIDEGLRDVKQQTTTPVTVQIYSPPRGEIMTSVTDEFSTCLLSKCLSTGGMQLKLTFCDSADQVQKGIPTLVLCIHASRIGLDVQTALSGIERSNNVAAIVFHHKAKHALPNQTSDRVLTAPEYKQLGGIFDMAFLSGQGLYPCDMNDKALNGICSFVMGLGQ